MAVGATTVCLGIHVAGVGWPWYLVYALVAGSVLGTAYYMDPLKYKKVQASMLLSLCTTQVFSHGCSAHLRGLHVSVMFCRFVCLTVFFW